MVDQHLRWNEHCNYITTKIRKMFYKFYQLRNILDQKLLTILYGALVESILRYCIVIWGAAYNNALHNLMVCQNSILKIIFNKDKRHHTELLYKVHKLLNIRGLFIYSCLNKIPKIPNIVLLHNYETRSTFNNSLVAPFYLKSHSQRNVFYYAPKYYNLLPTSIKELKLTKQYKNKTKEFILNNYDKFNRII